ncbi:hypothetical protein INT44_007460 [Umbelopsis vinacea]|uniref:Uncharacterized protein n=1 Tax=Umbelopsis vinacea TaxID=44442 RepID=A0A8H7U924_9FUNG|nr:hypothetical protein INT44_007460 [Umbelopsis vinacea]
MYTLHQPQPVQLPPNTYAGRDFLYSRSNHVNDKYPPPFFEEHSLNQTSQNKNLTHSRSLSSLPESNHPELKLIAVDELYNDSTAFREYIADHESSIAKSGVFTDALAEVFEAGKLFEKSVQILALAISDLITDKYFELEEKSEALLSNVANLMETFEERQNSVTETLTRFLEDLQNKKKKSEEILKKLAPSVTASRTEYEASLDHYESVNSNRTDIASMKTYQEDALAVFSSKEKLCKISFEYSWELTRTVRSLKHDERYDILKVIQLVHNFQRGPSSFLEDMLQSFGELGFHHYRQDNNHSGEFPEHSRANQPLDSSANTNLQLDVSMDEEFEMQEKRLHKSLSTYYEELRALCLEKIYGRSCKGYHYQHADAATHQTTHYTDRSYGSVSSSPPPVTPRSPQPNHVYARNEHPPMDMAMINRTSIRGFLYKKSVKNDVSIWRRRYFYLMTPEGWLMQYEDDQDDTVISEIRFSTVSIIPLLEDREKVICITSADGKEVLLHTDYDNELYDWMQALTMWQNIRPQDTRSSMMPMGQTNGSRYKTKAMSMNRKTSFSTISSAPYSGHHFNSTISDNSGILTIDMGYLGSNKNGAKNIFTTAKGRQKPTDFHPFSLSSLSIDATDAMASMVTSRKSFCHGPGIDGDVIKHGNVYLREVRKDKTFSIKNSYWRKLHCWFKSNSRFELLDGPECRQVDSVMIQHLNRNQIYLVSDSVFSTFHCFAIRTSPIRAIYLAVENAEELGSWVTLLKIFAQPNVSGCINGADADADSFLYRLERTLYLRVYEGKNISGGSRESSSELYCELSVEDEVLAITGMQKKTSSPGWKEDFSLSNLPEIAQGLTVTLVSKSKYGKDSRIGKVTLSVEQLQQDKLMGEWYRIQKEHKQGAFATLAGLSVHHSDSIGSLRIGTLLEERIILPICSYKPLIDLLANFDNHITIDLARKAPDLESFVSNALNIYEAIGLSIPWIKSLIDYEVSCISADDANTLFRGNSLLTKAIDLYMRMIGRTFLEQTIGDTIRALIDSKAHIEVDPTRTPKGANISENWKQLFLYVRSLWRGIELGKCKCPLELRSIFSHLRSAIVKKFILDDEEESNRQTIRYNCWIYILETDMPGYSVTKDIWINQPDVKTTRSLTLLAKCLMSLANLVDPSLKEPWMSFLHQFIMENTKSLMEFINFVSVQPGEGDDLLDDSRDYIENAYSKITDQFEFEKLPRTTLEDIPIPPNNIDLPKELSKMSSMITAWNNQNVGDRLASISKLCATLDNRGARYRKGAMYSADESSTHSKQSSLSHKGESTMFSCNYSDTEQSTEQLEVGSVTISSPMPEKLR